MRSPLSSLLHVSKAGTHRSNVTLLQFFAPCYSCLTSRKCGNILNWKPGKPMIMNQVVQNMQGLMQKQNCNKRGVVLDVEQCHLLNATVWHWIRNITVAPKQRSKNVVFLQCPSQPQGRVHWCRLTATARHGLSPSHVVSRGEML
jgi:hypothetical protein